MLFSKKSIRELDRKSIRNFVEDNKNLLTGRVLDFGCGTQPYKDLVKGEYCPYDKYFSELPYGIYNAILVTQVLEEVDSPLDILKYLRSLTNGYLLLTFNCLWEEYDATTKWRFTKSGMKFLLKQANFEVLGTKEKWAIPFEDFSLIGGYGFVCR